MGSRGFWLIVVLIGFVAVALSSVRSQDAPNTHIVLYMDSDTFILHIPEGASPEALQRIKEIVFVHQTLTGPVSTPLVNADTVQRFISVIDNGGGNCVGYQTAANIPIPSIPEGCKASAFNPSGFTAFWYSNNQRTSFTVVIRDYPPQLCASSNDRCIINLFPELTPTATFTPTVELTLPPSPSPIVIFPTTPPPTASVVVTLTPLPVLPAGEQCAMPIETRPVAAATCYQPGAFNASSVDSNQCVPIEGFNMSVHEITVAQASCGTEPEQLPRTSLTVEEAQQICQKFGGRLPTAAEWEYAARGPEYRLFPWGNEQNEEFYVHINNAIGLEEVTSTESGMLNDVSWASIQGMMGNASEWTASLNPDGTFVVFGGAFKDHPIDHGTGILSTRNDYQSLSTNFIGFRCVFPLEAMPLATPNVDTAWTPIEQDFDGVSMVYVPAGCFDMGSNTSEADESPAHPQCLEPFWIDQYEVKNLDFMSMGGTSATANRSSTVSQPVENLTWSEAKAFCELRGGRLPTEREWEYAARGPSNWLYPWGSDPNPENTVWFGNSAGQTAVVGSRPADRSWAGAFDMAGNVKEWVSTIYDGFSYPYKPDDGRENTTSIDPTIRRVARGSAWESGFESFHATNRSAYTPDQWRNFIGFRCVRPA